MWDQHNNLHHTPSNRLNMEKVTSVKVVQRFITSNSPAIIACASNKQQQQPCPRCTLYSTFFTTLSSYESMYISPLKFETNAKKTTYKIKGCPKLKLDNCSEKDISTANSFCLKSAYSGSRVIYKYTEKIYPTSPHYVKYGSIFKQQQLSLSAGSHREMMSVGFSNGINL